MENGDVRKLSTLLEVSQTLGSTLDLRTSLARVLEILEEGHGTVSGAVTSLDSQTGELKLEAATGITWQVRRRASFKVGEGVTGQVVHTGKPVVVPRVSHEPLFLDRLGVWKEGGKRELSFVCMPIRIDGKPTGSLGVTLPYDGKRDFDREAEFLGVVASMIGQAVRVHGLIETERQRLLSENNELRKELKERYEFRNIIGNSREMRRVYEEVAQVAGTPTTVMIRGDSGTGKELVAHAIHYNSPRSSKPFVKVNCGALPESLIESELFGYEPGAFTDARAQKKGRFELADGGTIFLDEVGELSLATQVKLLRVLQEREFERLGGIHPIKVDVRVVTATNRDLEQAMRAGSFREDLYYRLNVFSIFMPSLRDRKTDIPLLADHFVEKYATSLGKAVRRISTPAIDMLMSYHWPGNIRELENIIVRAILVCDESVIHGHHLPPTLQTAEASGTVTRGSLADLVASYERNLIEDALKTTKGNRTQASQLLQTTERILSYRLKQYGIDAGRYARTS
jgi:Nif-specific regulatory protein